jgi:MtaA/CmuA family methyltransferase
MESTETGMDRLSSRERMTRALRGDAADRPALAYLFLGGARHVLEAMGQSMRSVYADADLMASAQITAAELFGHDSSMLPWGCLMVEAEAFGCHLESPEQYYPQVVSRPLEDDPDLALLSLPDPETNGRMPLVIDSLTRLRARAGDDTFIVAMVVSPFLVAAELRSLTLLLTDFITDPPYVESLMEQVTEGIAGYVEAIVATNACDAIMFENAGATRDLIGPHHLTQFVTPYHRQLLSVARRSNPNLILIEHNCSETPYIDDILASDVDAFSFAHGDVKAISEKLRWDCYTEHTSVNSCIDRHCLKPEHFSRRIARIGNVDHTQIVLNATHEEVFTEARAVIESAGSGPFCLSTGCEIPFKAPLENIRALARAALAGF